MGVKKEDVVNHPKHYEGKYECINVMASDFGGEDVNDFCICNAYKYLWRWSKKNGIVDLKKARWYMGTYIKQVMPEIDLDAINMSSYCGDCEEIDILSDCMGYNAGVYLAVKAFSLWRTIKYSSHGATITIAAYLYLNKAIEIMDI